MKFFALGLSIFVVILGAWASRKYQLTTVPKQYEEILSQNEEVEESATPTPTPEVTPEPSQSPTNPPDTTAEFSISGFIYPRAVVKSQSSTILMLESSDDTDKITDWYKEKIQNLGANVKSFVVTRANDKVLNKLVGSNSSLEVAVEISKDSGVSLAQISVSFK
jgi:hypothetical protein